MKAKFVLSMMAIVLATATAYAQNSVDATTAQKLINDATSILSEKFNANDKDALNSALQTLNAEAPDYTQDSYDALNTAYTTAVKSVSVYATILATIEKCALWTSNYEASIVPMLEKYNAGQYSDKTTASSIYHAYQYNEIDALVEANAIDWTTLICNPSFETGDISGWFTVNKTDTGVKSNSDENYTMSNADGNYIFSSYGTTAENKVSQMIYDLPKGTYTLTTVVAGYEGETIYNTAAYTTPLLDGDGISASVLQRHKEPVIGQGPANGIRSSIVISFDDITNSTSDLDIKVYNTKTLSSSDASFFKCDDFHLYKGAVVFIDDQYDYDYTQEGTYNVILSRNIKAGQCNSLILPFSVSQDEVEEMFGEGSKVYEINSLSRKYGSQSLTFELADGITANQPCLLKAVNGGSEWNFFDRQIMPSDDALVVSEVDGAQITGSYKEVEVPLESYVVSNNKFFVVNNAVKMKPTRAYVNVENADGAKAINIIFNDEATSVTELANGNVEISTGIYDISGRKVVKPTSGLYIINGKKVLIP